HPAKLLLVLLPKMFARLGRDCKPRHQHSAANSVGWKDCTRVTLDARRKALHMALGNAKQPQREEMDFLFIRLFWNFAAMQPTCARRAPAARSRRRARP